MTELSRPIVGPLTLGAGTEPRERALSFDIGGGGEYLVPASFMEQGGGYQVRGAIYKNPNLRDIFGLGFELNFDKTNGGDYYPDQKHTRFLLTLSRGTKTNLGSEEEETVTKISAQNLYTGLGTAGGHTTLELGSDMISPAFFWRAWGGSWRELEWTLERMGEHEGQ